MKYKYTLYKLNLETDKREPIQEMFSLAAIHKYIKENNLCDITLGSLRYHTNTYMHFYFGNTFLRNNRTCFPMSLTKTTFNELKV
jgi:hypothetical protein